LADNYPSSVALVVLSLVPYLALSVAVLPLRDTIVRGVGLTPSSFDMAVALSTGAYTAGTVLAVQLATHFPARRLLVGYEALFVVGSVLAAWAPAPDVFIAGFVAQGLATSLMLIAAVPPLVTSWPTDKMPVTAAVMNVCIFGAVAAGPSLGAFQLGGHAWRPLFAAVAVIAVAALIFSLLTFEDDGPQDTSAPWDLVGIFLTVAGCASAFYGAGKLESSMSASPGSVVPLAVGFGLIVALVAYEYTVERPLMPIRSATSAVPLAGLVIALSASAAAFGLMELGIETLAKSNPGHTGLAFLPEFVAAVAVAGVFGFVFRTRFTPLLALGGLVALVAAAVVLVEILPSSGTGFAVATALIGIGAAASVSPALFMVGFSLPAQLLQRVFALVELLRGVTAFLVAPVLAFLAGTLSGGRTPGTKDAVLICCAIAAAGLVGGGAVYLSGRPWLEAPDLDSWQGDSDDAAWASPAVGAALTPQGAGRRAD
jgi:predicted MFS family arabinose efflux permease